MRAWWPRVAVLTDPGQAIGARHAALDQRVYVSDVGHIRRPHALPLIEADADDLIDGMAWSTTECADLLANRADLVVAGALPLQLIASVVIYGIHDCVRFARASLRKL